MNIKLSVTGLKELDLMMAGFPNVFNHRVMQAAHAEAAKPLIYKEHLYAPVGKKGRLADSIGAVKVPFANAQVIGQVEVGPRRGRFGGSAAHLIEFGTQERNFRGANRGKVTANPFLERAFEETKDQVINSISTILGEKAYSFIKRTLKNGS